jgi:CheY-like chemotaxis protein
MDFPSPGPTINGNANQIQQVLTNLIANASESYDTHGSVQLIVKTVSAESIPRSHRYPVDWQPQNTKYACLEVTDTGCGIADEDIEKIFDPFFTSKFTGRGLGLPVALGIIKTHNGTITVKSEPGKGSVFRAFLPVSAEAIINSPKNSATAPVLDGHGTVLLVEDSESARKAVRSMLMRLGFTVIGARNGREAVKVFHHHKNEIRCVLCDLTMPEMNGWETLTALRNLCPALPVVLVSGHDEEQAMADAHQDRPDAFLHKPFSRKELAGVIQQILRKKNTAAE